MGLIENNANKYEAHCGEGVTSYTFLPGEGKLRA